MNGINGLRKLNASWSPVGHQSAAAVALTHVGATISHNNTPHASRQTGAPWGVIFFRRSEGGGRAPDVIAATPRDEGDA